MKAKFIGTATNEDVNRAIEVGSMFFTDLDGDEWDIPESTWESLRAGAYIDENSQWIEGFVALEAFFIGINGK